MCNDISINKYISNEYSICREERQYALYLSNVLRYYGKAANRNEENYERVKKVFEACGFKDLENIVIENVYYEATFMRDIFERNRRIHLSDQSKTKDVCKQKTFTPSSYTISNKKESFNRKLLIFCWEKTGHPKTKEEEIDFNALEIVEFNYGQNDIPDSCSSIKNLTRAMMNSKPDLAVIYHDSKSDKKLLFLECKFDSGEDKVPADEGTNDYKQTEIQGYIAEFLCKYYKYYLEDTYISDIMEDPKNSGKYRSRKVQFSREEQINSQNVDNESGNIYISSLIDLEKDIFN